jgi:hypothetical protein
VGVLRRVRENVVKSGHVVGLGRSFLVLNPSRESKRSATSITRAVCSPDTRVKLAVLLARRGVEAFFEALMHLFH